MTTEATEAPTNPVAAAVEAVESGDRPQRPAEVTLSNGVVLALRPVPPGLMQRAIKDMPRPEPPKFFNEEHNVEESNEDDPAYGEALDKWQKEVADTGVNVLLLAGTRAKSVPDGYFMPEDDGWVELLTFLKIEPDLSSPYTRYMDWLNLHILASPVDYAKLLDAVAQYGGITEAEVKQAAETFRSGKVGDADRNGTAETDTNGHHDTSDSAVPDTGPRRKSRRKV